MKTTRKDIAIIISFGIIIGALVASQARAGIRVNARVRVPGGVIQVSNPNHGPQVRIEGRRHLPQRPQVRYEITRHDRKVAKRLARYTGIEKREILNLRRQGYRWGEIGQYLDLSRRTMQASMDGDTWKRFMRRQHRLGRDRLPAHREPNCRHDLDGWDRRW